MTDSAQKQLDALRWQVENEGCAASHLGETTYECRADAPCGLCRLRSERDRARTAFQSLLDRLKKDDRRAREAGATHENIREALQHYEAGNISFGRLIEVVRASAHALANNKVYAPTFTYEGTTPVNATTNTEIENP